MLSFELRILGSGAALPTSLRNPSAQYLNCNERHILIDCGEGTQIQLRKNGIKLQKINIILISHLHGDHFFGLVGLISSMHLLGRSKNLRIFGPEGLEQIVRSQLEIGHATLNFDIEFTALNGKESCCIFEDKRIEIHTFPLKHRIPCNGFRIQEKRGEFSIDGSSFKAAKLSLKAIPFFRRGENYSDESGTLHEAQNFTFPPKRAKSYAYCSDTMYWESIIPAISGVDYLYHEATFLEDLKGRAKATYHSTALQAAKIANQAKVGNLLLGHLSARYLDGTAHEAEAKPIFEKVCVVEDGDEFLF